MKKRSSKASAAALFQVALPQQGFFTSKQAKESGYTDAVHGYHIKNGDWERHIRGVYRLVMFPPVQNPHLMVWSLWSRGRDDQPVAVFSHETAMKIHQGQDVPEDQIHLTVPTTFRKGTAIPPQMVLHKRSLEPSEVIDIQGINVTSREKTRRDIAPPEPLASATNLPSGAISSSSDEDTGQKAGWAAWE